MKVRTKTEKVYGKLTALHKVAYSAEISGKESLKESCDCQNGGTCDLLTKRCHCPPSVRESPVKMVGLPRADISRKPLKILRFVM